MFNTDHDSPPTAYLSEVVLQFIEAKRAQRLSRNTLIEYERTFRRFQEHFEYDPQFSAISQIDIRRFMNSLDCLSNKSLLNIHVGLSSLCRWASEEGICRENVMQRVKRPKPEIRAIEPFSRCEVERMFAAISYSREYTRPGKRCCSHRVPNPIRNRAIFLALLDTGVRASELCGITFTTLGKNLVKIYGKGAKERLLPFSDTTRNAISLYVEQERPSTSSQMVFVTQTGEEMRVDELYHLILKIGQRAEVHAYPHKFRHTFAINFLRNGGNIYALQAMLGHASLEMVKRYLAIAQADIEQIHKIASPVTNWNLG